jgi:NADPH:quinone reductase-like Zn-dependent oxidoreductase
VVVRFSSTGTDVAGEVVSLGPGVKRFSPGDKVMTYIHILVSTHSGRTRC